MRSHSLDQQSVNFNYTEYPPEPKEAIEQESQVTDAIITLFCEELGIKPPF
ncbi:MULTISPECIES: hypothetical protein [Nostocales]|jgi:hypothetical protein|uniref:hypothetical protein n=1 Tax=Nostocales TaxID=1161 RepID=UPI0002DB5D0F|nr:MULTISPECIES: hypothetical protein [Nostocales]